MADAEFKVKGNFSVLASHAVTIFFCALRADHTIDFTGDGWFILSPLFILCFFFIYFIVDTRDRGVVESAMLNTDEGYNVPNVNVQFHEIQSNIYLMSIYVIVVFPTIFFVASNLTALPEDKWPWTAIFAYPSICLMGAALKAARDGRIWWRDARERTIQMYAET